MRIFPSVVWHLLDLEGFFKGMTEYLPQVTVLQPFEFLPYFVGIYDRFLPFRKIFKIIFQPLKPLKQFWFVVLPFDFAISQLISGGIRFMLPV